MRRKIGVILAVIATLGLFFYTQNNLLDTTNITIKNKKIPSEFNQFKIVHLSDLHSKSFGKEQSTLVRKVKKANPDIIVFTGDLIDSSKDDEAASLTLMDKLVDVAPVYYVTGNHEWVSGIYSSLEPKLLERGVNVMRNKGETITVNGASIAIMGMDDPAAGEEAASDQLQPAPNTFTILLAHRPERFLSYVDKNFNLVFSGHAHGGQVRLPFVGGLVAPNQGLLPTYTAGTYTEKNTTMVVSRGLGNSIIPQRIFNRPEIIILTLQT